MGFYQALEAESHADESDDEGDTDDLEPPDEGALLARLTRFYGCTPQGWLMETPMALLRACAQMLPRLQAEESLLGSTVTAVGSGTAGREARSVTQAWQRTAGSLRRSMRKPSLHDLASLGIAFVPVHPSPPADEVSRG